MVVDAHVHLLPGRLAEKVRAFFAAAVRDGYSDVWPFAYPIDHAAVLASMAADGVERVWSLPYAHKPGIAAGLNEASAVTVRAFALGPVQVVGGATVHPEDDDPAGVVVDAVDRLGLRVLKLHCSVGSFDVDDGRLDAVFAVVAERRLPVVVHLGHDVSGRTEAHELVALDHVASRHPEAPIVLAHCGHHAATAALAVLDAHPCLHADLTPVGDSPVELAAADIAHRSGRFLFGSDAPNTVFTVGDCLARVRALGLSAEVEAGVLGDNAERLISSVLSC
jgi:predicted TIM-barrel fold metal-dependent hydrolase